MAEEIWKPIPSHPGYEASTLGHIRNAKTGKSIRPYVNKNYNQVVMSHNGRATSALVANLVYEAFHPDCERQRGVAVHHKNEVTFDDRLDNLDLAEIKDSRNPKPVYAYQWGHLVYDFRSATEAAKYIKGSAGSIRNVCMGIGHSYRGFEWSYFAPDVKEDMEVKRDEYYSTQAVYKYGGRPGFERLEGIYDNYLQAADMNGLKPDSVLRCCIGPNHRVAGYTWDFADRYYDNK